MAEKKRLSKVKKTKIIQPNLINKKPATETKRKISPERQEDLDYRLFKAVTAGGVPETDKLAEINRLLNAGANIETVKIHEPGFNGTPAFIYLASLGQAKICALLLLRGADVNMKNKDGDTALKQAAYGGCTETCKLLLENGADVNAKNNYGETALAHAARIGYPETCALLIGKGADVNAKANDGTTALMEVAAACGDIKTCKLLIEKGADVNANDLFGRTALRLVIQSGHTKIYKLLKPIVQKHARKILGEMLGKDAEKFMSHFSECTKGGV